MSMKLPVKEVLLFVIAFIVMEAALIWALQIAPPDSRQGDVQRKT